MKNTVNADLLQRLAKLDPAALADANKELRVISPAIRPVQTGVKLLGIARTVRCYEDFLPVIAALDTAVAGEVLVIDTQASQAAVVGELFSLAAVRRGLAGIVIDGACRDLSTLHTLEMPIYARHAIPVSGTSVQIGEQQVQVHCGDVTIDPGDLLCGDDDGIVVMSVAEAAAVVDQAEQIKDLEQQILARMAEGVDLLKLLNYTEHDERRRNGDLTSTLRFLL